MSAEAFASDLREWIEKNTTWESYGYYGPLVYTGPLLEEIERLQEKHK